MADKRYVSGCPPLFTAARLPGPVCRITLGDRLATHLSYGAPTQDPEQYRAKKKELARVDHSQMTYAPFKKAFYIEVPEIKNMTDTEVEEYKKEMDGIKARRRSSQHSLTPAPSPPRCSHIQRHLIHACFCVSAGAREKVSSPNQEVDSVWSI